ncbi:MAG: BMP family ABC transporter substrate-binding protein [Spirochaetaceae bacterium]|nr:BMP family ABC transporter substrate-binding protein [Spirochaetaceae bacterium]
MTGAGRMVCLAGLGLALAGCARSMSRWMPGAPFPRERIVIGVVHIEDPRSMTSGYAYAHETGIRKMQEAIGLAGRQFIHKFDVYDTEPILVENEIRDCIAQGANIIIATSEGYLSTCKKLAEEFPQVIFAHATGTERNNSNFTNYYGRIYEARYLSGIAAGLKTLTNKVGYVAAMPMENSQVTSGLNAFARGVESVNPEAEVYVKVTHSWFDPMGETWAARTLIEEGCDVIAQHVDSPAPQIEAERAGVWGIGYNTDMSADAPGAVITSVVWHWDIYYTALVRSVIDGSFTTAPYFGGLSEGMVDITPINERLAAPGTAEAVAEARRRLDTPGFHVYGGVMQTNDGNTVGREGAALSDEEIKNGITWYYRNVRLMGEE